MIRKILKWIGIVLGGLVGLLVLAFVVLYIIGTVKWNKLHGKYDVPPETINIPTDQVSIARGEHIRLPEPWIARMNLLTVLLNNQENLLGFLIMG
jgi:hypothetical protein